MILPAILLLAGSVPIMTNAQGVTLDAPVFEISIETTVPVPNDMVLMHLGDMDNDGLPDGVFWDKTNPWRPVIRILELVDGAFVERFSVRDGYRYAFPRVVGDLDGDATPELVTVLNPGQVQIWEAAGNDHYVVRATLFVGYWVEALRIGDADDDGDDDLLYAMERQPNSKLFIISATGDNTFVNTGFVRDKYAATGLGGDSTTAAPRDLDGDGAVELVFADNDYKVGVGRTYLYEAGKLVFEDHAFFALDLTDLDGDGLGEMYGWNAYGGDRLRILESDGAGGFIEVYDAPRDGWAGVTTDVDLDGHTEAWRRFADPSGAMTRWQLGHLVDGELRVVADTGSLFEGLGGDVYRIYGFPDMDGDGRPETVASQDGALHFLDLGLDEGPTEVAIDIKPGSDVNPVRPGKGNIPVAILTDDGLQAADPVDAASLRFGATGTEDSLRWKNDGTPHCNADDVDGDGDMDLICLFDGAASGLAHGDTTGTLTGALVDGTAITGSDHVTTVGGRR